VEKPVEIFLRWRGFIIRDKHANNKGTSCKLAPAIKAKGRKFFAPCF